MLLSVLWDWLAPPPLAHWPLHPVTGSQHLLIPFLSAPRTARAYYAKAVELTAGGSLRALWGIMACTAHIGEKVGPGKGQRADGG